jgi:hypothetical protein
LTQLAVADLTANVNVKDIKMKFESGAVNKHPSFLNGNTADSQNHKKEDASTSAGPSDHNASSGVAALAKVQTF